ncbi:hypothetical protein Shyhy02_74030 [Streptomyces hygroscopicus subsp. hygroscopicus]|nr:hypothetical protein Shyhy02_74030 [Streptomyces hygroscopicus subsp. hygroscopicus]
MASARVDLDLDVKARTGGDERAADEGEAGEAKGDPGTNTENGESELAPGKCSLATPPAHGDKGLALCRIYGGTVGSQEKYLFPVRTGTRAVLLAGSLPWACGTSTAGVPAREIHGAAGLTGPQVHWSTDQSAWRRVTDR